MNYLIRKLCIGVLLSMGLLSGANATYVGGNPVSYVDPLGLAGSTRGSAPPRSSGYGNQLAYDLALAQIRAIRPEYRPPASIRNRDSEPSQAEIESLRAELMNLRNIQNQERNRNQCLSNSEIQRIQNAANRIQTPISLVGSRARGTARSNSDWDYVVEGNAKVRNSVSTSLPGAGSLSDGIRPKIDIFPAPLDISEPFIRFVPEK